MRRTSGTQESRRARDERYRLSEKGIAARKRAQANYVRSGKGKACSTRNVRKLKQECLSAYCEGDVKCACCGEANIEFLCLDHENGGGNLHRKDLSIRGEHFYRWLKRNQFPEGYRVLCHNCNMSLGSYGYCPHHPLPSNVIPFVRSEPKHGGIRVRMRVTA